MVNKPDRVQRGARFGRAFDAKKRAKFLDLIKKGHSIAWSAPQVGVNRGVVHVWLKSGRGKSPAKSEHAEFAAAFAEAEAQGNEAITANLVTQSATDPRAASALGRARGLPGFGPSLEQQARQHEAATRKAEYEAELAALKVEAERKALSDDGKPKVVIIVERELGALPEKAPRGDDSE